jgi:hypothetical protein
MKHPLVAPRLLSFRGLCLKVQTTTNCYFLESLLFLPCFYHSDLVAGCCRLQKARHHPKSRLQIQTHHPCYSHLIGFSPNLETCWIHHLSNAMKRASGGNYVIYGMNVTYERLAQSWFRSIPKLGVEQIRRFCGIKKWN